MSAKPESLPILESGQKAPRLFALDALRGLIIIFMAMDHANLLIAQKHPPSEMWGGAFPVYYDALAFLTRFVTHFAAPGFFLLMGAGMVLFARSRRERGWSTWQVAQHFLTRGLLLIALQLLVINRGWELLPGGWGIPIYVGVLVALGANMIIGSLLLRLKPAYLLVITLVLAVGTELLVPDPSKWGPNMNLFRLLFLVPGGINGADGGLLLWVNYPVLPWLELVTLGMVVGHWLSRDSRAAFSRTWKLGLAFLGAFLALRYLDGFGNIRPRMGDSLTDFLSLVKYPPSLTFGLLTTGVNLILLWAFSRLGDRVKRVMRPLAVFGRAPFVFYLLHVFLYVGLGYLVAPGGISIARMYPYWLLGLLILYPVCLWYGQLKHRQPAQSLLRFL